MFDPRRPERIASNRISAMSLPHAFRRRPPGSRGLLGRLRALLALPAIPTLPALPALPAIIALAALAALPAVTAGCGRSPAAPAGKSPAAGAEAQGPRRGGTVVSGWTSLPPGVNQLILQQTAGLVEMNEQLFLRLAEEQPDFESHPPTFKPMLARTWEWSPDHRVLTFHLRDDVRWSDGVPVTADDVRWTWQAQVNPAVAWSAAFIKDEIADVEAVDPHTVRFHFKRVYAKQLLDANEGTILPHHAWGVIPFSQWKQNGDWFRQHLVVDGPFTVASWQPQQEIVLRRNERFFDPPRPYLDRVVMRQIPDYTSVVTQLMSGDLDYAPVVNPSDVPRLAANPRLRVLAFWFRTWVGIAWNSTRPPFGDAEVRRALGMALDRPAIAATIWHGYARVGDSPIMASVWAHDAALRPLPFDPAEARRILAAKGFAPGPDGMLQRGGKPFAFELITNAGNQQRVDALQLVQAQLRRIGVAAQARQVEFNTLNSQLRAGTYDAAIAGQTMDTSLDLTAWFHSRSIGESNQTHYSNPEVDRLIDHAMSLPDSALAKPDLDRIQEILARDQPYTFLWESERTSALDRRLHGVRPNPLFSFFDLRDWWLEPGTKP
jgi:peptide/nickel transport system substrate-binding protein